MPTKIAEAQFHHIAEREGLPSLTLSLNGDPVNTAALDNFAFEVHSRFGRKRDVPARNPRRTPVAVDVSLLHSAGKQSGLTSAATVLKTAER
jgi:hypothetical protein